MSGDVVAYRNKNTQTIHMFDAANEDLETRSNFERVDLSAVPASMLDEARRERANRASINRAGERRSADKGVEITVDDSGELGGVTAATPTTKRTGAGSPDGVLSRPGVDDVQIGPDPELHPKTLAELEAQAALDAEVPENRGVLIAQHVEGHEASEMVPDDAAKAAKRLAPGTEVAEIAVKGEDEAKRSPRKAAGPGRRATATVTDKGDAAK